MLDHLRYDGTKVGSDQESELVIKLTELIKELRDTATRLQAIEDKLDSLDERMADLDRIELLREYDD